MVKTKAQALTQYVNHLNAIFKGEQFQILTPQGRQSVADQIDYGPHFGCGSKVDKRIEKEKNVVRSPFVEQDML